MQLHYFGPLLIAATQLACATTPWESHGSFPRTRETRIHVTSPVAAEVFVNQEQAGVTPLSLELRYTEEIIRERRKVSYWVTQPGWSLFVSILSFGIYVPFSWIPVDDEDRFVPSGRFSDNEFEILVRAVGYIDSVSVLVLQGESGLDLEANPRRSQ